MKGDKWDSFHELVAWATWFVIEAITSGKPLRSAIWTVLDVARRSEFEEVPHGN